MGADDQDEKGATYVSQPRADPPAAPVQVGRYVLEEMLGAGGMGVVHRGYDPDLQREVALKLIRGAPSAANQARLFREAQAMARLKHPHVVPVYDVGIDGGTVFIAMELVRGTTLRAAQEGLAAGAVMRLYRQAASGLEAAHRAGIVHRDFKPDNVLLDEEGNARVSDFGIARLPGEREVDGAVIGTPAYMAPEQLAGRDVDARADVFAFAVSLHESLSGRRPFLGGTVTELRAAHAAPPTVDGAIPARLRAPLAAALAIDPAQRPTLARLVAAIESTVTPASRRPLVVAALVIGCGIGGGLALRARQRAAPAGPATATAPTTPAAAVVVDPLARPRVAVLPLTVLPPDPVTRWYGTALGELLTSELAASASLQLLAGEVVAGAIGDLERAQGRALDAAMLPQLEVRFAGARVVHGQVVLEAGGTRLRVDVSFNKSDGTTQSVSAEGASGELTTVARTVAARLRTLFTREVIDEKREQAVRERWPRTKEASEAYARGIAAMRAHRTAEARTALEEVARREPRFAPGVLALAEAYDKSGRSTEARKRAAEALALAAELSAEVQMPLNARAAALLADWPRATELYEALHTRYPDDLEAGLALVDALAEQGKTAAALEVVGQLERLPPPLGGDLRVAIARVRAYTLAHQDPKAQEAARRAYDQAVREGAIGYIAIMAHALMDQKSKPDQYAAAAATALAAAERAGNESLTVRVMSNLGAYYSNYGDQGKALPILERAVARARGIDDPTLLANVLFDLGQLLAQSDHARARPILREVVAVARVGGQLRTGLLALQNLAILERSEDNLSLARKLFEEVIGLARGNFPMEVAFAEDDLAQLLFDLGKPRVALALHQAQRRVFIDGQMWWDVAVNLDHIGKVHLELAELDAAERAFVESRAAAVKGRNWQSIAYSMRGQADLAFLRDQGKEARRLLDEALADREKAHAQEVVRRIRLQRVRMDVADGKPALAALEAAIRAPSGPLHESDVTATLALAKAEAGQVDEARALARQARAELAKAESVRDRVSGWCEVARALARTGDQAEAHAVASDAMQLARDSGLTVSAMEAELLASEPGTRARRDLAARARKLGLLRLARLART